MKFLIGVLMGLSLGLTVGGAFCDISAFPPKLLLIPVVLSTLTALILTMTPE